MNEQLAPFGGLEEGTSLGGEGIWKLLAARTALYTGSASTSVPVATAGELLCSLCYTLGLEPEHITAERSTAGELEEAFRAGQELLRAKLTYGHELWRRACDCPPPVYSRTLTDTLDSIGGFFKRYDLRFFAHHIPCDIDYPLCAPVNERIQGVDYILRYLDRIQMENDLLRRFSRELLDGLLRAASPDYGDLPVNLYEPAAVNLIGRSVLGLDCRTLSISPQERRQLEHIFAPMPPSELEQALTAAARTVGERLELEGGLSGEYLCRLAVTLAPRIVGVRDCGGLSGVFLTAYD